MKNLLDWLEKALRLLAGAALTTMCVAIFWQVILRYLFGRANVWAEELARYSFVWLVMLGSAIATRRKRHMSIDFIKEKLPTPIQLFTTVVFTILIGVFLSVVAWQGVKLLTITSQQLSGGMRIPMSYPYLAIPVGAILMILFLSEYLLDVLKSVSRGRERGSKP